MKKVEEVWELLRREVHPREPIETALADALGSVLREDVRAEEDHPAFDRSAVDGFVVREDCHDGEFRIVGEVRAGDGQVRELLPGEAWRIGTGAMVPEGGEVVMLEDAADNGDTVRFTRRGRDHVRRRGEDACKGDVVVPAGTELGAGAIGLLAALGCARPIATKPIEVLHVATGNELIDAGGSPSAGQIRDSNSPLVAAWAKSRGLRLAQRRIGENTDDLRLAIEGRRDLLLVSGGASVGRHDCTADVLASAGFEILVRAVSVRPGKPLIVGRRHDAWAFGLPGNPLSHFVCLNVFVDAALGAMRGEKAMPVLWQGCVKSPIAGNARETWWPSIDEGQGIRPLAWRSSGDMTAIAAANCLVRVPSSGLAAGEKADFIRVR